MIKRVFRQMLVTQIVSAMTVMLCMLIDSIMIGRFLGVDSMTAYGLATPVLLVFAAFGSLLSAGIQVMTGKTMGTGDIEATNDLSLSCRCCFCGRRRRRADLRRADLLASRSWSARQQGVWADARLYSRLHNRSPGVYICADNGSLYAGIG